MFETGYAAAQLAREEFIQRLRKYLGAYCLAVLSRARDRLRAIS